MSITRQCKKCGTPFEIPYESYKRYTCSKQCARDSGLRTCRFCKEGFYARSHNQVLCSEQCRDDERAKLQETGLTPAVGARPTYYKVRFNVLKRDEFRCRYCGRNPRDDKKVVLHIDHLVARSQGGDDSMGNLVTACEACNLGKSDYILTLREASIVAVL